MLTQKGKADEEDRCVSSVLESVERIKVVSIKSEEINKIKKIILFCPHTYLYFHSPRPNRQMTQISAFHSLLKVENGIN